MGKDWILVMSYTDSENDINLISNLGIHEDDDIDLSDTSNNLFDLYNFNNFNWSDPTSMTLRERLTQKPIFIMNQIVSIIQKNNLIVKSIWINPYL